MFVECPTANGEDQLLIYFVKEFVNEFVGEAFGDHWIRSCASLFENGHVYMLVHGHKINN